MLLEYDKRFAVYKDFIFYDYKNPLAIARELGSAFDVVLADPPFLADECLTKTAVTVKFMAKNQIILCTGTCQLFNHFPDLLINNFLCFRCCDGRYGQTIAQSGEMQLCTWSP